MGKDRGAAGGVRLVHALQDEAGASTLRFRLHQQRVWRGVRAPEHAALWGQQQRTGKEGPFIQNARKRE